MATQRIFYIAQGSLTVFHDRRTADHQLQTFSDDEVGLRRFGEYLASSDSRSTAILVDVIEEEFAAETIPFLRGRDRRALMNRRMRRRFPRTPYRLTRYQGRQPGDDDEALIIHSAISNHELLDPWLQAMLQVELPISGVYSVPMLAPELLPRFHKGEHPVLFLTTHSGNKLRQVFVKDGQVQSARLSQCPPSNDPAYADFVVNEVERSRRYLERSRLLSNAELLDVCLIADAGVAEQVMAASNSSGPLELHFVDPRKAWRRLGAAGRLQADNLERLYIALLFRRTPGHNYAVSGETRFLHLRRYRHALIGAAATCSLVCAVAAGWLAGDSWSMHRESTLAERQLSYLTETFRRENDNLQPIQADSYEMKLAVDTGDFILANRLPVAWVLQQVGLVMGDYPDMQVRNLRWQVEVPQDPNARPARRTEASLPVAVPATAAVNVSLDATLMPFDGDMRKAFARIDTLVERLRMTTRFHDIAVVEYPLDARPQASLAGEIGARNDGEGADFQLRLRINVDAPSGVAPAVAGESHETT